MKEIESLLHKYRERNIVLNTLNCKKRHIQRELERIPDEVHYTNNTSLLKFEPSTNKINRMVENAGIRSSELHNKLKLQLQDIEGKIEQVEQETELTECLLSALEETERFIIEQFYFLRQKLYSIPNLYFKQFGVKFNNCTIIRKKQKALEKMKGLNAITMQPKSD